MPSTSGEKSGESSLPNKKSRKRMSAAEQYVSDILRVFMYLLEILAVYKLF